MEIVAGPIGELSTLQEYKRKLAEMDQLIKFRSEDLSEMRAKFK
jgi:hypothetical protein